MRRRELVTLRAGAAQAWPFAIGLLVFIGSGAALADPVGLWRGSDGGTTRISTCGSALCGFLASVAPRNDPETGRPWADKHNPDPAKRIRPLVGVQVLMNMRSSGPRKWSGLLYYYEDGRNYQGHIIEQGPSNIRIEGCSIGFCGGENLVRVK
jgi:uncharacterized protein (DUF2147 family)